MVSISVLAFCGRKALLIYSRHDGGKYAAIMSDSESMVDMAEGDEDGWSVGRVPLGGLFDETDEIVSDSESMVEMAEGDEDG